MKCIQQCYECNFEAIQQCYECNFKGKSSTKPHRTENPRLAVIYYTVYFRYGTVHCVLVEIGFSNQHKKKHKNFIQFLENQSDFKFKLF